jgi:hypothetical protein
MSDLPWVKWEAYLGYKTDRSAVKEVVIVNFRARSLEGAESYARRHAEAMYDVNKGPWWRVIGPLPEEGTE